MPKTWIWCRRRRLPVKAPSTTSSMLLLFTVGLSHAFVGPSLRPLLPSRPGSVSPRRLVPSLRMPRCQADNNIPSVAPFDSPIDSATGFPQGPSSVPNGLMSAGVFQNFTQRAVMIPHDYTVGESIRFIQRHQKLFTELAEENVTPLEILYIKSSNGSLVGYVLAADLLMFSGSEHKNDLVSDIARTFSVILSVDDDPEDMLRKFRAANFALRAPLLDAEGRVVGVINPQDVLRQQEIENTDDMLRFSGVLNPLRDTEESMDKQSYFGTSIWTHIRQRSAVLTMLLLLQSLSSVVLSKYQGLIERNVFLALFLTMLTGTGGNAGNQSSALIIRGLSTGEINDSNSMKVIVREIVTSSVIAIILALAAFGRVMLTKGAPLKMGLILAFSTYATVVFAIAGGTVVPLFLERIGLDPCNLSSPMLATLTDILGVLLLCVVSTAVLGAQ